MAHQHRRRRADIDRRPLNVAVPGPDREFVAGDQVGLHLRRHRQRGAGGDDGQADHEFTHAQRLRDALLQRDLRLGRVRRPELPRDDLVVLLDARVPREVELALGQAPCALLGIVRAADHGADVAGFVVLRLPHELKQHFRDVRNVKPKASRQDSSEVFLVATGFKGHVAQEFIPKRDPLTL